MKLKKNDNVEVIAGKNKGKTGKISSVLISRGKVLIDGVNMYKKHVRPKRQGEKGQTISVPRSLDISNVMLVCPSCGKRTRVGIDVKEGGKNRYCKKCKAMI